MPDGKRHRITVLVMGETLFRERVIFELKASRFTHFEVVEVATAKAAFGVLCTRPCDVLLADAGLDPAAEPGLLSPASRMCVVLAVKDVPGPATLRCLEAGVQDVLPVAELSAATLERVLCSALIRFQISAVERQLRRGQAVDPLTGLYTAETMGWHLQSAIEFARRFGDQPAMVLLSIDEAELEQRRLGRFRTGLVVQEIARRLRWCVRQTDFMARVGSLRFAVFMRHVTTEAVLGGLVQRLLTVGKAPLLIQDELVPIRLRAGAALCIGEEVSLRVLLDRAERSFAAGMRQEPGRPVLPTGMSPSLSSASAAPAETFVF